MIRTSFLLLVASFLHQTQASTARLCSNQARKLVKPQCAAVPPAAKGMELASLTRAPVLTGDEIVTRFAELNGERAQFAMYNSLLGGIIKDPTYMNVPMDDHMVHRGHGVFDTAALTNGRLYRLEKHMDRFMNSAEMARLAMPVTREGAPMSREDIRKAIIDTVAASGQRSGSVRYWMSAGPGNFSWRPEDCTPALYVMVFGHLIAPGPMKPHDEVTMKPSEVPQKPPALANIKSNNYLLNVLDSMAATDKGGKLGIWIDEKGYVAEGCVANVTAITKDGILITPRFEKILKGCTVQRVLELAEDLVAEGVLKGVEQRDIHVDELYNSKEMFMSGGDTHILPVRSLDGKVIGDGETGPIATRIEAFLTEEANSGDRDFIEVDYDAYSS